MVQVSGAGKLMARPVACTPASVRPAAWAATGWVKSRSSVRSNSPCTDRPAGWRCHPTNAVPSKCNLARKVRLICPESSGDPTPEQAAQILVPFDKSTVSRVRFFDSPAPPNQSAARDPGRPVAPCRRGARPRGLALRRSRVGGLLGAHARGGHAGPNRGPADGPSRQGRDPRRGRRSGLRTTPGDGAGDGRAARRPGGHLRNRRRSGRDAQHLHRGGIPGGGCRSARRQARESQLHLALGIGRCARGAGRAHRPHGRRGRDGPARGRHRLSLRAELPSRDASRGGGAEGAGRLLPS